MNAEEQEEIRKVLETLDDLLENEYRSMYAHVYNDLVECRKRLVALLSKATLKDYT